MKTYVCQIIIQQREAALSLSGHWWQHRYGANIYQHTLLETKKKHIHTHAHAHAHTTFVCSLYYILLHLLDKLQGHINQLVLSFLLDYNYYKTLIVSFSCFFILDCLDIKCLTNTSLFIRAFFLSCSLCCSLLHCISEPPAQMCS